MTRQLTDSGRVFAASLLSLLRAARPYPRQGISPAQAALVLRGGLIALLAVFVTIQADVVALARHPRAWAHSPIGTALALGLVVVALASLAGASLVGLFASPLYFSAIELTSGYPLAWLLGSLTAVALVIPVAFVKLYRKTAGDVTKRV
jgi:hypothetical protein